MLLHDNARPHTARKTIETITQLGFEVLEHLAYRPNLGPSDYYLFGPVKDALGSRRFSSDKAVHETVYKLLQEHPKTFFSDGIHKLVERWSKCIEKDGNE